MRLENETFAIFFLYRACFPGRVIELSVGERLDHIFMLPFPYFYISITASLKVQT
jgi:hypothetical protein